MTTLREAAQMALNDICGARLCEVNSMSSRQEMLRLMDDAIAAIRAALAQQEQEPVPFAYYWPPTNTLRRNPEYHLAITPVTILKAELPLFLHPPRREPLAQQEQEPVAYRYWSSKWHQWEYTNVPLEFPAIQAGVEMEPLFTGPPRREPQEDKS